MSRDDHLHHVITAQIENRLNKNRGRPLVVGLCGAQGSGKSTAAADISAYFNGRGVATAILSIDDLYRTKAERQALAKSVHPLLQTRGVPGTHDVALGLSVLESISTGRATVLPRFDKTSDDRAPRDSWEKATSHTRLLIFEGWCVGALPQPEVALASPINDLERIEDPDRRWRHYVNEALAGEYQNLFARIDLLVLLEAPAFETVFGWRIEQEHHLRQRTGRGMTDEDVIRFVGHYERITRHILEEMPSRADLLIKLDERRSPVAFVPPSPASA